MSDRLVVNKYLSNHACKSACIVSNKYICSTRIHNENKVLLYHIEIKPKDFSVSKVKLSLFVGGGLERN